MRSSQVPADCASGRHQGVGATDLVIDAKFGLGQRASETDPEGLQRRPAVCVFPACGRQVAGAVVGLFDHRKVCVHDPAQHVGVALAPFIGIAAPGVRAGFVHIRCEGRQQIAGVDQVLSGFLCGCAQLQRDGGVVVAAWTRSGSSADALVETGRRAESLAGIIDDSQRRIG